MRAHLACSATTGSKRRFGWTIALQPLSLPAVALALIICTGAKISGEDNPQQNASKKVEPTSNLNALVRGLLEREVRAQADDKSLWCYRKLLDKDGKRELFASCQTEAAEIDRLLGQDGKPLTQKQSKMEDQRIKKLLNSPSQLKKQKQQQLEDARQATRLLKMIPDAFVFQQESKLVDRIKLKFAPNPKFRPSGSSEMVFHRMEGTLTLDLKHQRLVEISGHLTSEVKFGGGLLGHLDKGGTFLVEQQEVGPGCWKMTMLDVQMNGKALFFKTISVRTKEIDTDFHPVPGAATIEQVAALTNENAGKELSRVQK